MKSLLVLPPRRSFTYTTLFFTCTILSYISIGFHAMCDGFASSFYNLPDIQYGPHNTSFRGYSNTVAWHFEECAYSRSSRALQNLSRVSRVNVNYWVIAPVIGSDQPCHRLQVATTIKPPATYCLDPPLQTRKALTCQSWTKDLSGTPGSSDLQGACSVYLTDARSVKVLWKSEALEAVSFFSIHLLRFLFIVLTVN